MQRIKMHKSRVRAREALIKVYIQLNLFNKVIHLPPG